MEELKAYCEVPHNIDLKLMYRANESTLNGEHNGVFFTWEHLTARLRFPVSAIVKQFLHFTRGLPALVHPNVIYILIDCCVLNHLYQLDLSLVELFIIYFLRIGQGGQMSMSFLSPRLQVVNGLPDSPKKEAKGTLLVRGPWDETPSSLGLPFNIKRSQFSQVCGRVRSGLTAFFQIFCVLRWTNLGLFMLGKLGEAGWLTRWRSRA